MADIRKLNKCLFFDSIILRKGLLPLFDLDLFTYRLQCLEHDRLRLGENISAGLIEPLIEGSPNSPNPTYQLISQRVSEITNALNLLFNAAPD
jgi:hypothetical protein